MKTEIKKAVGRIIRLKESLGFSKAPYVVLTCCVLLSLIVLIFAYQPLMAKLHNASNRLEGLETELLNQRSAIDALKRADVTGKIIRQSEIPLAMDELTEKARELGLQLSVISPSQLQQTTHAGIWKLPVSFTLKSKYENVGQFLDYIKGSSRIIAEPDSLSIHPQEDDLSKLDVELVLNLYVERKNETKQ
jgi:Tfp pilus assembly protein PilO